MDIEKRDALVRRVGDANTIEDGLPLVTLEEFFEGNDDPGSIWCNLGGAPGPPEVYRILRTIRDRSDVHDLRVMVTQCDGGPDEWPFSDTVYFITSADADDVALWLGEDYAPDEIEVLADFGRAESITVPPGFNIVACWWD